MSTEVNTVNHTIIDVNDKTAKQQAKAVLRQHVQDCAERSRKEADDALIYLSTQIEKTRLWLEIPVEEWVELIGFTSTFSYKKMMNNPRNAFGISYAYPIINFCLLFGYSLKTPEDVIVPRTLLDLSSIEVASALVTLPEDTLKDIAKVINRDFDAGHSRALARMTKLLYPKDGEESEGANLIAIRGSTARKQEGRKIIGTEVMPADFSGLLLDTPGMADHNNL